jgi:hypothetical protein
MNPAQYHTISLVEVEAYDEISVPQLWLRRTATLASRADVIAAGWFVAIFFAVLWIWGTGPITFPSPDESVNRFAASLVSDGGRPFLAIPHSDAENMVHPRFWVTLDDHAIPAYPPLAYYIYAALISVPLLGPMLIASLPASAAAAFSAGVARLLPGRRFLAAVAPAIAFPALYWYLRPWMNISLLLVFLSWAFFAWVQWRNTQSTRWLIATCVVLAGAAAVRPDYAPYIFLTALLLAIAEMPARWRLIVACMVGAGIAAILVNGLLNALTTGNPLRAAYQLHAERQASGEGPAPTGIWSTAYFLFLPWGFPDPRDVVTLFDHYWLRMGPIVLLFVGQAALIPLLRDVPSRRRMFYVAALAVMVVFMISRISDSLYGATESTGLLRHSVPRYWSPIYLFAALPPLIYAARSNKDMTVGVILAGCVLLGFLGVREIYTRQPESMTYLRDQQVRNERRLDDLSLQLPNDAITYTMIEDKILWSRWHVAIIGEPIETATSMERSLDAGYPVYVVQSKLPESVRTRLAMALLPRDIELLTVDEKLGVYRVEPGPSVVDGDGDRRE